MLHGKKTVIRHIVDFSYRTASVIPPVDTHAASRLRNGRHVLTQLTGKFLTPPAQAGARSAEVQPTQWAIVPGLVKGVSAMCVH